jgi:hypothetical protein
MTILIIIASATLAALAAWVWPSRNRARKFAEQRAGRESERLAADRKRANEEALAEAKAREEVRLQAEAEERSRKEAEARENARLVEEQRRAAEKLAAQAEAKRRSCEIAFTEAQLREAARLKAEAEAKQRAEAEERENARLAAEEKKRAEERRQAQELARAEAEARERARIAAEEEARRQAEEKIEKQEAPSELVIEASSRPKIPEPDETPRPPVYRPTALSPTTAPSGPRRPTGSRTAQTSNVDLRLRVQLVFGRGGVVRNLALAPDRHAGMPSEVEVTGTQGELHLTELREDCYETVELSDAGNALTQGIEWRGRGDARQWRWILGGRELYVLAPGDDFGLHGFVSAARLWLNARHVVLTTKRLRDEVLAALAQAGCATAGVSDETVPGVPAGWLLFRDVIPTRAVPMRHERDILNALCPAHEIEPHFVGGIRLERNTWLAGYPPRIRFTGEFANGFEVKIDGQLAQRASDGAFEALGWDTEGEHRLWFGDQAETYSLCTMEESWGQWHAHDFGTGVAICGASTCQRDNTLRIQVRVPVTNRLLIGARPGEISCCHERSDVRCETLLATVPFVPVWALPVDPAHADKRSARIFLLHPSEPQKNFRLPTGNRGANRQLIAWSAAVREAGCKGLCLNQEDEQTKALWQRYRIIAKQLRRKMR